MNLIKPGTGAKPNPTWFKPLHVSHLLKNKIGAVAPGTNLKPYQFIESIRDQGSTESCVGQGTSSGFELTSRAYNYVVPNISAMFSYWLARLGESPVVDQGSSPFDCIRNISKYGVVAESRWKFDPAKINVEPPLDVWENGLEHKITGVFGTYGTEITTIKQCLDNGFPICFAQTVDDQMDNYSSGVLGKFDGTSRGSHYQCIVDYVDAGVVVLNSWGLGFGIKYGDFSGGFSICSWERIADPVNCSDFLVFDVGPSDL